MMHMQSTMAVKNITLDSGHGGTQYYRLFLRIEDTGKFCTRGSFTFAEDKLMHEGCARWREDHKEYLDSYHNSEEYKEAQKKRTGKYYIEHREEIIEHVRNWQTENPEKWKINMKKTHDKRYRGLGYETINEPFPNSEGHHFNKEHVIYIPAELHQSIRHNIFTGKNMEEINKAAFEWLDRELIRVAFEKLDLNNKSLGGEKE